MNILNHHASDIQISQKLKRRKIGNFLYYKNGGGLWQAAANGVSQAPGAPPNWSGQFDFRDQNITSALQFFSHDTTDADNRAMVGIRLDGAPDLWINYKAYNPDNLGVSTTTDGDNVSWTNLWTNSTLKWTHGIHKVNKEIILSAAGHPSSFSFTVKNSPGSTLEIANNTITIRDAQGNVRLKTLKPYGVDANGNDIRCTLTQTDSWGPAGIYPIITITPNADDMASATYPVVLDPTTQIDDTGIEDTYLYYTNGARNFGASSVLIVGTGTPRSILMRVDESLIPAGTLTSVTLNLVATAANATTVIETYKILSANVGWVEGTGGDAGALNSGETCWVDHTYSDIQEWAGNPGCAGDGTDYASDASPPTLSSVALGANSYDLGSAGVSWFTEWRDTPANNAGHISTDGTTTSTFKSTDNATSADRPSYDIVYEAAAAGGGLLLFGFPNGRRLI